MRSAAASRQCRELGVCSLGGRMAHAVDQGLLGVTAEKRLEPLGMSLKSSEPAHVHIAAQNGCGCKQYRYVALPPPGRIHARRDTLKIVFCGSGNLQGVFVVTMPPRPPAPRPPPPQPHSSPIAARKGTR